MKPRSIIVDARIDAGSLRVPGRKLLLAALRHWPDGPVNLEIRPYEERRRQRANRYYWGVVLRMMAEEGGHTPDDLHDIMKVRHNGKVIADPITGEEVKVGQSTAKLNISQFSIYLDAVMLDGAEWLGLTFPEPRASEEYREAVRG